MEVTIASHEKYLPVLMFCLCVFIPTRGLLQKHADLIHMDIPSLPKLLELILELIQGTEIINSIVGLANSFYFHNSHTTMATLGTGLVS